MRRRKRKPFDLAGPVGNTNENTRASFDDSSSSAAAGSSVRMSTSITRFGASPAGSNVDAKAKVGIGDEAVDEARAEFTDRLDRVGDAIAIARRARQIAVESIAVGMVSMPRKKMTSTTPFPPAKRDS